MIVSGALAPGMKLAEIPTAEMLGVSRTPVRSALATLAQEGLLERIHQRGFHVRRISKEELVGAVEVRSVLEGLAARQAVERGLSNAVLETLQSCLDVGDQLFAKRHINEEDIAHYHDINKRFHATIISASGNPAIEPALARNEHLPFASPNAIRFDKNALDREFQRFAFAHQQHHTVVDAMRRGQGARAEALMREHAYVTIRYVDVDDFANFPDTIK
jgi:GntR family transcriptional regulator, vanillate catabolism transcriptional regulator